MKSYWAYIITNKTNGTLYIGSTSDLGGRIWEHKNKTVPGSFSAKYNLDRLVHYEGLSNLSNMVNRERNLKDYKRAWKLNLINHDNPQWEDLSAGWYE